MLVENVLKMYYVGGMKVIVIINSKGGCGKSTLALSLADVLGAQIVDLDYQSTITNSAKFTGRHKPIMPDEATANYIVYDTPPYRDAAISNLVRQADYIVIPSLLSYPDLLAIKPTIDLVATLPAKKCIVFNRVKRTMTSNNQQLRYYFEKNYGYITSAKTEISELKAFQNVLTTPLAGVAKKQIEDLVKELLG